MAGKNQKVRTGDSFRFPSETYNEFIENAMGVRSRMHDVRVNRPASIPHPGLVWVRNKSGNDVGRSGVLGIDGVVTKPSDNENVFVDLVFVDGVTPATEHVGGRFVIMAHDIEEDLPPTKTSYVGRAYAEGIFPTKVKIADEAHLTADCDPGVRSELLSSHTGVVQLLWIQEVADRAISDIAWCIVRFGGGGGGGAVTKIWAKITASQGNVPPYTYSATEQEGTAPGVFGDRMGGLTWAGTLRNLAEIGGVIGAAPLPDNSNVLVHQADDGTYYFDRLHYRGVYG